MSNFFIEMLGRSVEKDLSKSNAKNPIDAILGNPMIKQIIKANRKEITEAITKGEQDLINLIESVELEADETQAAPILDIETMPDGKKELRLIVAAFTGATLTRTVSDIPLREFLLTYLTKKLK